MTKKNWCLDYPFQKIQSRALSKGKNSENILTSNLAWPKKVGAQNPPPQKFQSPEHLVKEKNSKKWKFDIFWPQI